MAFISYLANKPSHYRDIKLICIVTKITPKYQNNKTHFAVLYKKGISNERLIFDPDKMFIDRQVIPGINYDIPFRNIKNNSEAILIYNILGKEANIPIMDVLFGVNLYK